MRPAQRDPRGVLVGEVLHAVGHPRRDVRERLRVAVQQPLALDPLVGVPDVDELGAALVGGSRDLAGQLLLADVARDAERADRAGRSRRTARSGRRAGGSGRSSRAPRGRLATMAPMRLNRYLARAGVASRRAADELIKAGRVTVNGQRGRAQHVRRLARRRRGRRRPRRQAGARARPAQQAARRRHDGERPGGPPDGRRPRRPRRARRAGRPARHRHERRPAAHERRRPRPPAGASALRRREDLRRGRRGRPDARPSSRRSRNGVELEDGITAPARARQLGRSRVELVLHEGRNRQVRRMCEAVGHPGRAAAAHGLRGARHARRRGRRLAAAHAATRCRRCAAWSGSRG